MIWGTETWAGEDAGELTAGFVLLQREAYCGFCVFGAPPVFVSWVVFVVVLLCGMFVIFGVTWCVGRSGTCVSACGTGRRFLR